MVTLSSNSNRYGRSFASGGWRFAPNTVVVVCLFRVISFNRGGYVLVILGLRLAVVWLSVCLDGVIGYGQLIVGFATHSDSTAQRQWLGGLIHKNKSQRKNDRVRSDNIKEVLRNCLQSN